MAKLQYKHDQRRVWTNSDQPIFLSVSSSTARNLQAENSFQPWKRNMHVGGVPLPSKIEGCLFVLAWLANFIWILSNHMPSESCNDPCRWRNGKDHQVAKNNTQILDRSEEPSSNLLSNGTNVKPLIAPINMTSAMDHDSDAREHL